MSEQEPHNDPWADKLAQVSLPDLAEAKQQLFLQMDKDAPVVKRQRRWPWLLALLLILLIGVCNCPGAWKMNGDTVNNHPMPVDSISAANNKRNVTSDSTVNDNSQQKSTGNNPRNDNTSKDVSNKEVTIQETEHNITRSSSKETMVALQPVKHAAGNKKQPGLYSSLNHNKSFTIKENGPKNSNATKKNIYNSSTIKDIAGNENKVRDSKSQPASDSTSNIAVNIPVDNIMAVDSPVSKIDSANNTSKTDSTKKKAANNKSHWSIAIGCNQGIPINGQQYAWINAHGNGNVIGDYIPVPQVRYHINDKLYLQLELDVHSPQYTTGIIIAQRADSLLTSIENIYIKKLYYFRVPLGVYYGTGKHFYAGAGIQFSRLVNATALYETGDSLQHRSKLQGLKNDPAYSLLHTTDWGFYADISYHWKNLIAGARYNKSFGNFIDTAVPGFPDAKAANSSLQLYIRYTIWRSSRQKKSAVK
jgi:hypothetical protein